MANTQFQGWRRLRWDNSAVERPVAHLLLRLLKVPDHGRNAPVLCRGEELPVLGRNLVALDRMEILVSKVRGFADALTVQQSESAVKWHRRRPRFLEEIGVSPVAHTLQQALAGLELAENIRRADVRVMHQIARSVTRAPFRKVEGQARELRCLDLLANPPHVADYGVRRWGQLGIFLAVLVQETTVDAIGVGGDE